MLKLIVFLTICVTLTLGDYWSDRAKLIQMNKHEEIGSDIILTDKETRVNNILMNYKLKEFDDGFLDPGKFLPAQHFFKSKTNIEKSKVFQIIQKLPKGGSLHSHDSAMVSQEFLYNITFSNNLYGCVVNEKLLLHFFKENTTDETCNWRLLSELRKNDFNFDNFLKSKLTLIVDDPMNTYTNINVVWQTFMDIFATVIPLITYKPIFQDYFYQCLKEFYEDNVMYVEFRGLLPAVYDLDGKIYSPVEVAGLYVETLNQFKNDYNDFIGSKFIYAPSRKVDNNTLDGYIQILTELQSQYPYFIAGFDLVGQEDLGEPLIEFVPKLLEIENRTTFFFHAGETDWNGESDTNLYDAVLLNTKRIGHGYAILKHPVVADIVKERQIALEVSPISNQVLKLVDDIRNHPGSALIAGGYPVVISCDDPTFWGAKGLSYDWYMAFMGLASRDSDLSLLKQLAINSLIYSTIDDKETVLVNWNKQWNIFLDKILSDNSYLHCFECYNYYNVFRVK